MDLCHFTISVIAIQFYKFIYGDREKLNRDVNTWRIKPKRDGIRLEQGRTMRQDDSQREIELWYNEKLWQTGEVC